MITRPIANELEAQWAEANNMNLSAIRQFEAAIRAALLLTKSQVQLAQAGKAMWDYSGIAQPILTTPSGAVGDGIYDAAYHREIQGMWGSYMKWLASPITVVVNGQTVTLDKCPLDLIMSTPVLAAPPETEQPE